MFTTIYTFQALKRSRSKSRKGEIIITIFYNSFLHQNDYEKYSYDNTKHVLNFSNEILQEMPQISKNLPDARKSRRERRVAECEREEQWLLCPLKRMRGWLRRVRVRVLTFGLRLFGFGPKTYRFVKKNNENFSIYQFLHVFMLKKMLQFMGKKLSLTKTHLTCMVTY